MILISRKKNQKKESINFSTWKKSAAIFKEEFGEDVVEMLGYNPLPLSIKVFINEESFEFDKVDLLID